jgi:putative flippase GtrA
VVPTRNEAGNIAMLVARLAAAMSTGGLEIVFVDDSDDDTPRVIEEVRDRSNLPIRVIHRVGNQRIGGLGGAVVEGMAAARAPWVCVMDGDLQHPPETLPDLLARAMAADPVDLVIASRYCEDGDSEAFGPFRSAVSKLSTAAATAVFPRNLRDVTDPMSGFFLVRRSALRLETMRPNGFKVLLETIVRHPDLRVAEVPFRFGVRHSGETKASPLEALRFARQLAALRFAGMLGRFGRFGLVGLSGLVVNTLVLAFFVDLLSVWYVVAAILATQVSTGWNFVLTDRWVFRGGTERRRGPLARATAYFAMNNVALLARIPLLYALVTGLGMNHVVGNVISLVALTVLRFGLSDGWIWAPATEAPAFNYDIHGIVTIASEGRLPELARFAVDGPLADPDIRVRIGRVRGRGVDWEDGEDGRVTFHYVERFGNLGFGAQFDLGDRADITATPLLRRSPHVLYTNIVEPVLRWRFVEKGYALVHAACLSSGEDAFLITARTDTGKTTTALKTLDALPFAFLSDDLTLLSPEGQVLTYPKPLTISRHTVSAVRTPLLSRTERMKLIPQSRLHSKSGRLFGLLIARTGLPAATMNALVQMVVPPPKFQVDRLVPHVTVMPEAQVRGMAIIQRDGEEGFEELDREEALEILLANCEDAYGFPPYPAIQHWLHSRNGRDLRGREREIVTGALVNATAQLLRSPDRNWHRMFPEMVRRSVPASLEDDGAELAL